MLESCAARPPILPQFCSSIKTMPISRCCKRESFLRHICSCSAVQRHFSQCKLPCFALVMQFSLLDAFFLSSQRFGDNWQASFCVHWGLKCRHFFKCIAKEIVLKSPLCSALCEKCIHDKSKKLAKNG